MKKTLSFILVVITILACSACGAKDESVPPEQEKQEKIEYKIHVGSIAGEAPALSSVDANGNKVVYHSASELDFDTHFSIHGKKETKSEAPVTKTLNIGNQKVTLQYNYSQSNQLATSKITALQQFGRFDCYILREDNRPVADAAYDAQTGKLVSYFLTNRKAEIGDFTVEQAKEKAVEFICSWYGENAMDGYELVSAIVLEGAGGKETIKITYNKFIFGIPTSEHLIVCFDRGGNVVSFNAEGFGLMDAVKGDLSKEKIQNAEKALLETFSEDAFVQDDRRILVEVASGVCYLEIVSNGYPYYINIT